MDHVVWWVVLARAIGGSLSFIWGLWMLLELRDNRVWRQARGQNGMESEIIKTAAGFVWFVTGSLFLTSLNAWLALPIIMQRGPYVLRQVIGASILLVWTIWGMRVLYKHRRETSRLETLARKHREPWDGNERRK